MVCKEHLKEFREAVAYVGEEPIFFSGMTLQENIEILQHCYADFSMESFREYLTLFEIPMGNMGKCISECSSGEKKRIELAFALAKKPKLLLLDEPTANFDREFRAQFLKLITEFIADGEKSVVMATHNTQDLDQIADYIGFLHQGKMVLFTDRKSLENRYRIVQGERYRIKNLPKQDCIYIEEKKYSWKALMRHRRWRNYEKELEVHVPTIEELMCCLLKANEGKHGEFLC